MPRQLLLCSLAVTLADLKPNAAPAEPAGNQLPDDTARYTRRPAHLAQLDAAPHQLLPACLQTTPSEARPARHTWYSSMLVNSGLWRAEMPSLRKMRPISYTRSRPPTWGRGAEAGGAGGAGFNSSTHHAAWKERTGRWLPRNTAAPTHCRAGRQANNKAPCTLPSPPGA